MKAQVDQKKCGGVGVCVMISPEIFRFQEGSKKAAVMLDPIPRAFHEKCRKAKKECPNQAISIEE